MKRNINKKKVNTKDPPFDPSLFVSPENFNIPLTSLDSNIPRAFSLPSGPSFIQRPLQQSDLLMSNSWFSCQPFSHPISSGPSVSSSYVPEASGPVYQTSVYNGKRKKNQITFPIRTRKVAINPNSLMRVYLKQAFHVNRIIYNECVWLQKTNVIEINQKNLRFIIDSNSPYWLLQYENPADGLRFKEYLEQVPYDVRDEAIKDFIKAYEINMQKHKDGKLPQFFMHYRRKCEMNQETIVLRKRSFKFFEDSVQKDGTVIKEVKMKCYPKNWKNGTISFFQEKVTKLPDQVKISMSKGGKFYLILSEEQRPQIKVAKNNAVALDPGVRIFQTTYDTKGESYLIGKDGADKLDSLAGIARRMRAGIKRYYNKNGKKRFKKIETRKEQKSLNRAADRIERKIKNMVTDLQRKTVKFLCEKYDTVIIPEFKSQQMAKKARRKIGKTTARKMLRWSHYKFRELLKEKGEMTGTKVIVGTEEFTSKTCGNCMYVNNQLKGERELTCKRCGIHMHRDINGARNILLHNWLRAKMSILSSIPSLNPVRFNRSIKLKISDH